MSFVSLVVFGTSATSCVVAAFNVAARSALAQEARTPNNSGDVRMPDVLPRSDFQIRGSVGRTYLEWEKAKFAQPVQPLKGAPNVDLILLDDVGFGHFSTLGGGVPPPTMEKLAVEGLRYKRFHTTPLCSPTRALLITGRNQHSASFAGITELATAMTVAHVEVTYPPVGDHSSFDFPIT